VIVGAKHSLTVFINKVRSVPWLAFRSHVIASHYLRLFQPPRSKDSPTPPALVCSCSRVSQTQPSTAPHCVVQKQKPRKMLCGLGSWREQQQGDWKVSKDSLAVRQDHTVPCGVLNTFLRLDATLDGFDYTHNLLWRVNYFFSNPPLWGGFAPFL